MLEKAKEVTDAVAGTAREASENYKYSRLEVKYGKEGAEAIIKPHLEARDISVDDFRTYRKVKRAIQNQGLDVAKAQKEADREALEALQEYFPA